MEARKSKEGSCYLRSSRSPNAGRPFGHQFFLRPRENGNSTSTLLARTWYGKGHMRFTSSMDGKRATRSTTGCKQSKN
jgi:hypothetical protein